MIESFADNFKIGSFIFQSPFQCCIIMTVEKLNSQRTVAINRLHEVLKSKEAKIHNNSLLKLAKRIEKEIHLNSKNITSYKIKYRRLVFNIKDPKNLKLSKNIIEGTLSPKDLIRMSFEEMGNEKLKQEREEIKKNYIENVISNECDLQRQGLKVIVKTHKGEEVREIVPPNPDFQ